MSPNNLSCNEKPKISHRQYISMPIDSFNCSKKKEKKKGVIVYFYTCGCFYDKNPVFRCLHTIRRRMCFYCKKKPTKRANISDAYVKVGK